MAKQLLCLPYSQSILIQSVKFLPAVITVCTIPFLFCFIFPFELKSLFCLCSTWLQIRTVFPPVLWCHMGDNYWRLVEAAVEALICLSLLVAVELQCRRPAAHERSL